MVTSRGAAFLLLWILCLNGTKTRYQELTKENCDFSRNSSTLNEEVPVNSSSGSESSRLLPPSRNISECAMPWSCCDHEASRINSIPQGILKCSKTGTLLVSTGYCATVDEEKHILEAGKCIYNYKTISVFSKSEFICNKASHFHRTGTLLGKCQDGYYPLAYSYDMECVQCPNGMSNWWKFVLAAFLPLTIFYLIILFFRVNVVSSRSQGFLFYSQMISWPFMMRILFLKKHGNKHIRGMRPQYLAIVHGIWNFDFFRSVNFGICLGTDMLLTLALDLIVGAYPLLLMVVSYVLIELYDRNFRPLVIALKPFCRLSGLFQENWDLRTSLIDAFASTFLLTNVKFLSVSHDLLTPVTVYQLNATGNWTNSIRLFYDPTIPYFGLTHLPYAITALVMLMLFAILPVLLLVLYPFRCFQKLLNLFPFRWYILHTFVEAFYGSYKDGTQPGTRDCRWFASLFILSRFSLITLASLVKDEMYLLLAVMIPIAVVILFINVQPFKENVSHFTTINALFLLLLAVWYASLLGTTISTSETSTLTLYSLLALSTILSLLYIFAIVFHWMYSQRKFWTDVRAKSRAWRNGYAMLS